MVLHWNTIVSWCCTLSLVVLQHLSLVVLHCNTLGERRTAASTEMAGANAVIPRRHQGLEMSPLAVLL